MCARDARADGAVAAEQVDGMAARLIRDVVAAVVRSAPRASAPKRSGAG